MSDRVDRLETELAAMRPQPLPADLSERIAAELAPCFVEADGRRTDTVVLACTHFPLLLERLERLSPWPVNYIDPAPAIARRVVNLLGAAAPDGARQPAQIVFTSGRVAPAPLFAALGRFGLTETTAAV